MTDYTPLKLYLQQQTFTEIPMSFRDVAQIVGRRLPASALCYRSWWANETRGHSQAKAWMEAGYETSQVDMESSKLVFRRRARQGVAESKRQFQGMGEDAPSPRRSPLFGALKGTFTIEPGYDLTRPALNPEEWDAALAAMQAKFDKPGSSA